MLKRLGVTTQRAAVVNDNASATVAKVIIQPEAKMYGEIFDLEDGCELIIWDSEESSENDDGTRARYRQAFGTRKEAESELDQRILADQELQLQLRKYWTGP